MHGIDHIRLYDRGSVDNGLAEVEPWRQTGFISFETNIGEAGEDISRQSKQLKSEKIFFDKVNSERKKSSTRIILCLLCV